MESQPKRSLDPILGAVIIFLVALVLTMYNAYRAKVAIEAGAFVPPPPMTSPAQPIGYFLAVVVVMGLILFLIPMWLLRWVFKATYAMLFAWGVFIVLALTLPVFAAIAAGVIGGLAWVFRPRVWLHNLLMVVALAGAGAVFGLILSPWAAMVSMLALSVYDVVAVRVGYMMWMARRLSESDTLPVFFIPKTITAWNLNLKGPGFQKVLNEEAGQREFSILGGGDIGFPMLLVVSVFSSYGFGQSMLVGGLALVGLVGAYVIQMFFLKGKPMPALPPIALASFIGFGVVLLNAS